jgi:tRNA dimethylallyltransferase
MSDIHHVMILTGATASGKSALAADIAARKQGMVINADSMQLYYEAPILTAQPTAKEREVIPHKLYSVLDAESGCSVAEWVTMACTEIQWCWDKGYLPIVVGGTGMYLRALMQGLSPIPDIDPDIRDNVRKLTTAALQEALRREDPAIFSQLHPTDTQRMARALEVVRSTGYSLLYWQDIPPSLPLPEAHFQLYITSLPRPLLYERINHRVEQMLAMGALEEVRALHRRGLDPALPLMRAVGVKELIAYLNNDVMLEEAADAIKTASRQYAKRQMTWMRHQFSTGIILDMTQHHIRL